MNKPLVFLPTLLAVFFAAAGSARAAEHAANLQGPAQVINAYLRATYARDYVEAYRFISAADRKVRDVNRYVQQRGAFSGFTLEVARKLSESVEIEPQQQKATAERIRIAVRYRVPDPKKISPMLLNWDPHRLNSLGAAERRRMLDALEKKQQDRSLEMNEGEERFELVKEANEWRVFLNWAAGVKIPLRLDLSKTSDLEVSLSEQEVVLQPGEVFEIFLKIKNKTKRAVTARIGHLVEPNDSADYLDFVQCGFLLPVTISPGAEQEYSGSYLLRGSLPEGVRRLSLTYDFRILQ
jgi:hypothetical protein